MAKKTKAKAVKKEVECCDRCKGRKVIALVCEMCNEEVTTCDDCGEKLNDYGGFCYEGHHYCSEDCLQNNISIYEFEAAFEEETHD